MAEILDLTGVDLSQFLPNDEKKKIIPAMIASSMVTDLFWGDGANFGWLLPWSKTHHNIRIRPYEVSIWAGINGHGKSLALSQVVIGLAQQNVKTLIISPEMPVVRTMARMTRQGVGIDRPAPAAIEKFHDWTDNKVWLYDEKMSLRPETVIALCWYAAKHLKLDHVIIDSLMKCGIAEDNWNKQKWFVNELCTCAYNTGLHISLVAHSKKTESENRMINKFEIKGTGTLTDMVDNVFTVWRNKRKEVEGKKPKEDRDQKIMDKADAVIVCDKQRHGEWEGAVYLWFNMDSMQFHGQPDKRPTCVFESGGYYDVLPV